MLVLLMSTLLISVSRAKEARFVLKGGSVRLDAEGHEGLWIDTLFWTFNTSTIILRYFIEFKNLKTYKNYENRIEFDKSNFSLLLKNVQSRDSGIYTARVTDNKGQRRDLTTYRLTVQEAPPIPQVKVVLLSSAGGVCNMSVNCSAEDNWASYTCDHAHCTQEANPTSPTGVNLIVTTTNGTIHCSSSNRVDSKTQFTKDVCSVPSVAPSPGLSLCALKSILFSIGLVAMVSAVIAVNAGERCCREK